MPFIAMLAGEVIGAWLSDRVDKRAAACFISMAGAAVGLAAVMHLDTPLAVIAAMSFSTFMWGTGAPNIFALLAKATHPRVSATAGGYGRAYRLHPQHGFRADFSGGDGGGGLRPVTAAAETLLRRVS